MCFPVNIGKFLKAQILKNIREWLLLKLASDLFFFFFFLEKIIFSISKL